MGPVPSRPDSSNAPNSAPLLELRDLCVEFPVSGGQARAVHRVSLHVRRGEVLGLVGESGCGKSMTALAVLRLVPPPGRIMSGHILFDGHDLLTLSSASLQRLRGKRLSMIFQEPMTALNPVLTVHEQIGEMLRRHLDLSRKDARTRTVELLRLVGIPSPENRAKDYPHQLSGGMRQRVMIAMAISCDPDVVFADEPTTALDVTVQAQILDLLRDLRERLGMAMILISHNLGVVAQMADRVAVMYAGQVVEETTARRLFSAPQHPYTQGLLASLPPADFQIRRTDRLSAIPGIVPALHALPPGCAFSPRCPAVMDRCTDAPPLQESAPGHLTRCWLSVTPP